MRKKFKYRKPNVNKADVVSDFETRRYNYRELASIHECSHQRICQIIQDCAPTYKKRQKPKKDIGRDNEIICLRRDGLTYTEISDRLSLSRGQVAGVIFRNMQKLVS